ncbi:hypothetical protein [Streptomyces sp. MMG1121]|uniref:hypothetical protein n=1 Tax=Streptomyces sp. MMG1121 TaxID=1415544 RepID=UPI0006AF9DD3|nr:hypothetical protein [Streptomyces sp. MMG1121]KOV56462.1 hypothetical protein ADK64_41090 [Streptomyces sp. MMG1121]
MGRPEKPVDRTVPACAKLADFLRGRRTVVGLTYQEMADRMHGMPSEATFKRAASGAVVPAWDTIKAFVETTITKDEEFNGDLGVALGMAQELWVRARRATRAPYYLHKAPDPSLIASRADLGRALRDQHAWCGAPSPREMETKAGLGELPSSTVRRVLQGRILPVSTEQTIAFLLACGLPSTSLTRWRDGAVRAGVTSEDRWDQACAKLDLNRHAETSAESGTLHLAA